MTRGSQRTALAVTGILVAAGALWARTSAGSRPQVREVSIVGDQYAFSPSRVEVQKDDVVQVTFTAKDIPHSFTIDVPYRISKRASPGQAVTFEFRADESGRFRYYCNLTQDDRCKKMIGELVVR